MDRLYKHRTAPYADVADLSKIITQATPGTWVEDDFGDIWAYRDGEKTPVLHALSTDHDKGVIEASSADLRYIAAFSPDTTQDLLDRLRSLPAFMVTLEVLMGLRRQLAWAVMTSPEYTHIMKGNRGGVE